MTGEETEAEVDIYFFRKSFGNFTGKTPVLESLFKKVAGPRACNFNEKRLQHRCCICEIVKSTFFYRKPPVAAF